MPSQEELDYLKTLIRYNPDEGRFYWLQGRGCRAEGSEAGNRHAGKYSVFSYKFNGKARQVRLQRLAWYFSYGEWHDNIYQVAGSKHCCKLKKLRKKV
jgi:hypothetical protein